MLEKNRRRFYRSSGQTFYDLDVWSLNYKTAQYTVILNKIAEAVFFTSWVPFLVLMHWSRLNLSALHKCIL